MFTQINPLPLTLSLDIFAISQMNESPWKVKDALVDSGHGRPRRLARGDDIVLDDRSITFRLLAAELEVS